MKKTYTKPMIAIEKFNLTQTVAQSCGVDRSSNTVGVPSSADKSTCGWDVGGTILWVGPTTGCNFPVDENTEVNGMCFNNPNGGATIFAS